jgi:hypothetical protein
MLGLLGLPNDTTMETRSFQNIEDRIAPKIWQLTQDILRENLVAEVKTLLDDIDFALWEQSIASNAPFKLPIDKYPKLNVSFDMGWQQRSSGNRYNSPSGHALLVGGNTRKPVALCISRASCAMNVFPLRRRSAVKKTMAKDFRSLHTHARRIMMALLHPWSLLPAWR